MPYIGGNKLNNHSKIQFPNGSISKKSNFSEFSKNLKNKKYFYNLSEYDVQRQNLMLNQRLKHSKSVISRNKEIEDYNKSQKYKEFCTKFPNYKILFFNEKLQNTSQHFFFKNSPKLSIMDKSRDNPRNSSIGFFSKSTKNSFSS